MAEKRIPEFAGYSVDDKGNVYSYKRGWKSKLKPLLRDNGYLEIRLRGGKESHALKVHRLVADAFVSGKSKERNEVNHIDNNRANNEASNLEWVTHSENMAHRTASGWIAPVGEARKSNNMVVAVCLKTGSETLYHSPVVAEKDGFSSGCIYAILAGRIKTHKGFTFRPA